MSAFPFTVGDKVRRPNWGTSEHVVITAVGACYFLALWPELPPEHEAMWAQDSGTWLRYGAVAA